MVIIFKRNMDAIRDFEYATEPDQIFKSRKIRKRH
jgi:hypothetical protein